MTLDPYGFVHVAEDGIARSYAGEWIRPDYPASPLTCLPSQRRRHRLHSSLRRPAHQHGERTPRPHKDRQRAPRRGLRPRQWLLRQGRAPDLPPINSAPPGRRPSQNSLARGAQHEAVSQRRRPTQSQVCRVLAEPMQNWTRLLGLGLRHLHHLRSDGDPLLPLWRVLIPWSHAVFFFCVTYLPIFFLLSLQCYLLIIHQQARCPQMRSSSLSGREIRLQRGLHQGRLSGHTLLFYRGLLR
jgi:hypothetical protein